MKQIRIDHTPKIDNSFSVKPKKKVKVKQSTIDELNSLNLALNSFKIPSKTIVKLMDEGKTDAAVDSFQKNLLSALVRMIPKAEAQYMNNPGQSNAYALNSIVESARRLVQDIRATSDRNAVATEIINEYLIPAFRTCVQDMVTEHYHLKSKIKSLVKDEDRRLLESHIDECAKQIAIKMSEIGKNSSENISRLISE